MKEEIFLRLKTESKQIKEADMDEWIIPSLLAFYDRKMRYLASHAYSVHINDEGFGLSFRAFKKEAAKRLKEALTTFYLDKRHWVNGRPIKPYLDVTLDNLANSLYWEYSDKKSLKSRSFVCPLCREKGFKPTLIQNEDMLRCPDCERSIQILTEKLSDQNEDLSNIQHEYFARSVFALHSKGGFRCPDCLRFMPESAKNDNNISCPYGNCPYFGTIDQLDRMNHPTKTTLKKRIMYPSDSFDDSVKEYLSSYDVDAEEFLLFHEDITEKERLINKVINEQAYEVKRNSSEATKKQKLFMYKAFKNMLEKQPIDMIHYLCHQKQTSGSLQSKIFQEYASLIESYLPFTINKSGKEIDIVSLTDPDLALFQGISEFEAIVQDEHIIPNLTKETYIGGRSYKDYGPCFIGKLIDIINLESQESLINNVVEYSFSRIQMQESVRAGTRVSVKHFRILSHYEMDSLVFLQQIRKRLVDSLYFRIHKKRKKAA